MTLVGLIGGTGDLGSALAVHFSKKHVVMLGSRSKDRAISAVEEINREKNHKYLIQNLRPAENSEVVMLADFLVLTVPHESALETITNLSSKFRGNQVLVSAAAAVTRVGEEFAVDEDATGKSLAQKMRDILPEAVRVAAAFQTIPATILYREKEISADVPVAAESVKVYEVVASFVSEIEGLRPLFLGTLRQSGEVERLTSLLLNLGKRNGLKSPTVKFPSFQGST